MTWTVQYALTDEPVALTDPLAFRHSILGMTRAALIETLEAIFKADRILLRRQHESNR